MEIISTRAIESGDFNYLFVRKYPLVLRPVDVQAPSDCQFFGNLWRVSQMGANRRERITRNHTSITRNRNSFSGIVECSVRPHL